jgi:glutamate 5-kinase
MLSRVGDSGWGQVVVDDGAVAALRRGAVSLLPAGVRSVVGDFSRGDIIYVSDLTDQHVACGIANYSAADVGRIRGMRSDRIVDTLGYHYGQEVIHRNNLVLI